MGCGWRSSVSIIGRYRGILNTPRGGWTPDRLGAAMVLWLDAADPASQVVAGNQLAQWNDKSLFGRQFTQPLSIRRPTLALNSQNGLPGVSFNGFSQSMSLTSSWVLTGNPEFSAFVIYRKRTLTQGSVYAWGSTSVALGSMILFDNNVLTGYAYAGDNNFRIQPVPANTTVIQSVLKTPGRIDTTTQAFRDGANTDAGGHSTLVPNLQGGPLWIGGFNDLAEFYLNGIIYEMVITSTSLPEVLHRTVEGYMAHRWGTFESLTPDHPFRFVAP